MITNKGYKIEERMRKFFRGKRSYLDEVDFETSTSLYEVKSCKIFNLSKNNGNQNRSFTKHQHKCCPCWKSGRFVIETDNHIKLFLQALKDNKIPKYIFVVKFGNQVMFRVLPWEAVMLSNSKSQYMIHLNKIFREEYDEKNDEDSLEVEFQ